MKNNWDIIHNGERYDIIDINWASQDYGVYFTVDKSTRLTPIDAPEDRKYIDISLVIEDPSRLAHYPYIYDGHGEIIQWEDKTPISQTINAGQEKEVEEAKADLKS